MTREKKVSLEPQAAIPPVIIGKEASQVIFADRIINFGLGPQVSRLEFGIETDVNTFTSNVQLVIPTSALLTAIGFMQTTIHENKEVKTALKAALEALSLQIDNL